MVELWVEYWSGKDICVGHFLNKVAAETHFNSHKESYRDAQGEKHGFPYGTPIYRKFEWEQMNEHLRKKKYIKPASEKFYRNPEEFSRTPTALCAHGENTSCTRGEFGYCYSKLGCSAKRELDGSGQMLASEMALLNNAIAATEVKE